MTGNAAGTLPLSEDALSAVPEAGALLVGVSGGVDSMALLACLHARYGGRLIVCHVNHGLRGEEADGDESFVRLRAETLGVKFLSKKGNVAALAAEAGLSMESAARAFRYECFREWSRECGTPVLLLAHHANDQAETVLFNLCRGGAGARGMRPVSERDGLTLIRPLLALSRPQIETFARASGLVWREDRTNAQPVAVRNELRNEVIPALERIMRRPVCEAISRAAELEWERALALDELLERENLLDPQGRLFLPKIETFSPELRRAALYWYLKRNRIAGLSRELVLRVETLLTGACSCVNLPGGGCARRREKRLFIEL